MLQSQHIITCTDFPRKKKQSTQNRQTQKKPYDIGTFKTTHIDTITRVRFCNVFLSSAIRKTTPRRFHKTKQTKTAEFGFESRAETRARERAHEHVRSAARAGATGDNTTWRGHVPPSRSAPWPINFALIPRDWVFFMKMWKVMAV